MNYVDYGNGKPNRKKKNPLYRYHKNIDNWELNIERIDVSEIIGGDSKTKMLYLDDKILLDWSGAKESGAHKIDTGQIGFIDISDGKNFADITVKRGYAKKITIYDKDFAENIDNYEKMPFYSTFKKTFA